MLQQKLKPIMHCMFIWKWNGNNTVNKLNQTDFSNLKSMV